MLGEFWFTDCLKGLIYFDYLMIILLAEVRTIVPERTVSGDVDIFLLAECDEVVLREKRVGFDLEDRLGLVFVLVTTSGHSMYYLESYRDDTSCIDDAFQVLNGEIGNSNRPNLHEESYLRRRIHNPGDCVSEFTLLFGSATIAFQVSMSGVSMSNSS